MLGSVLSGAGPPVLMFLDPKARPDKVRAKIESYLREKGMRAELLLAAIARRGGEASFQRRSG